MKYKLAAVLLVAGSTVWGCGSAERPRGAGGEGGTLEGGKGGSGGGGATGTGGSKSTGGTGGGSSTGGSGPGSTGGSNASGGAGGVGGVTGGKDASADGPTSTTDGPAMSGGDLWAKCGPEAFKADVSAADFCARYISVCKASISMDACMSMYNGISDGPKRCRACTAYYACIAGEPDVMAMSCLYVSQGLAKNGPCKPSYCD
jgi:hypothetical protein